MLISTIHPKELSISPPPMTAPSSNRHHRTTRFNSTRMVNKSITHPHPQTPSYQNSITNTNTPVTTIKVDEDNGRGSNSRVTRRVKESEELRLKINRSGGSTTSTVHGNNPVTSSYNSIQPTPLRQVINLNHLLRENSKLEQRKLNYPTFDEILYELSLNKEEEESHRDRKPILKTYDIKESIQSSGSHHQRRRPTPQDSPSLLGSKATSLDVIRSTLMDGPYRQAIPSQTQSASSEYKIRALGLNGKSNSSYPTKKPSSYFTSPETSPRISRSVTGVAFCSPNDKTTHRARTISSDPGKLRVRSSEGSYDSSSYNPSHRPLSPSSSTTSENRLGSSQPSNSRTLPRSPLHSSSNSRGPSYSEDGEDLDLNSNITRDQPKSTSTTTRDHHHNNSSTSEDRILNPSQQKVTKSTSDNLDNKGRDSRSKPNLKVDTRMKEGRRGDMETHPRSNNIEVVTTASPQSYTRSDKERLIDWRQLDKIGVKLIYHPLTKESKLIYLDEGVNSTKRRLPKGTLIPAHQLLMDRSSSGTIKQGTHLPSSSKSPLVPSKSLSRKSRSPHQPTPSSTENPSSIPTIDQPDDESRSNRLMRIRKILAKSGSDRIARLSRVEEVNRNGDRIPSDGIEKKSGSSDVVPTSHPQKLLPVTSAFDRRVRILFGAAVPIHPPPNNRTTVPRSIPAPHPLRPHSPFTITGSGTMGCNILRGELYKCNSRHQWQKREFRTDGFVLVCLTKETLPLPSIDATVAQPDYHNEPWHTHFQPTTSHPTPHVTHPLLATPPHDDPAKVGYYQVAKYVIPLDQVTHLSLLTRKGVPISNGFVIHTKTDNYLLRATDSHEWVTWLYLLNRMVKTVRGYRFNVTTHPDHQTIDRVTGKEENNHQRDRRHHSSSSRPSDLEPDSSSPTTSPHPHHPPPHSDPTPNLPAQRKIIQNWIDTIATLHRLQ